MNVLVDQFEAKKASINSTDPDMKAIYRKVDFEWARAIPQAAVRKWLMQYEGDHIPYAKKLLKNFRLYTFTEVQEMCRALWREHFKSAIIAREIAEPGLSARQREKIFDTDYLPHVIFTRSQVEEGPKSGGLIEYVFQGVNHLPPEQFVTGWPHEELPTMVNGNTKYIVVLDDFTGTGIQLCKFWKKALQAVKTMYPHIEIHVLLCAGLVSGIKHVEGNTPCHVHVVQRLTEQDRVFSPSSTVFDDLSLSKAEDIFRTYGRYLNFGVDTHALGFNGSQLNIGFQWHPPNNTLPVIWKSARGWNPLLERARE